MYPYIYIFNRTIGTYGLCMAVAVILVGAISIVRGKKIGLVAEDILIVGATAIAMALLGGNLLYIAVTYSIEDILEQIRAGDLTFLGSGIVFYGGLIGGVLGAFLGIKIAGCRFAQIEKAIVPGIPLGHAIGRIGCLMAGCCYGMEYEGFGAVHYCCSVSNLPPEQGYFPVQPIESLLNFALFFVLLHYAKRQRRTGDLLSFYLGCYAVNRFVLEFFRGDAVRGVYFSLSVSQWISIFLLVICVVRLIVCHRFSKTKDESNIA